MREPRGGAAEDTAEVTVAEGGSVTVGGVTMAVAPGAVDSDGTMRVAVDTAGSVDVGDAATPVVEAVLVDAELVGSATIDLPIVGDGVDPSTVIGGFVDDEGTFRPLESTVGPGGRMLRITTPHFTSFLGVHVDPGAVLSSVADRVGNLLTGRAGADQPRCDGEDDARSDGVEVTSDSGDLVKWCFGRTSAGRALTVTNNRSAAVLVTYPAVWAAGDVTGGGVSFESVGAWLSSQAPLPEGLDARVVGGGSSIVFTLPDGAEAGTVEIEMDLLTWAFSGFDIAVSAGLAVYQRFLSVSGSADEIVSGALTAGEAADAGAFFTCFNEVFGGDLDPRQSVADAGFDDTARVLEFAVRCGFDTVKDWVEDGGLNVVARTVVGVVSAALGFVVAGLNAVFAGLRNLYDTFAGSVTYTITVGAGSANTTTVQDIDFQNTTFPANSCSQGGWASSPPITVVGGEGTAGDQFGDDDLGQGYAEVYGVTVVGYSDFDRDERQDAAVVLFCSAGGTFGQQVVVPLTLSGGALSFVGGGSLEVLPIAPSGDLAQVDTLSQISGATLDGSNIVVNESYDATGTECQACHTGRATIRWSWTGSSWTPQLDG